MPIYAYKCESCGHAKDVLQKMSDPLLTDCPACGAATFKKQLTAAGFQLKGSGWYATDFKGAPATAGTPSADKAEGGEGAKTDSGDSSKSAETKTDAKTESKPETKTDVKAVSKPDSKPASGGASATSSAA